MHSRRLLAIVGLVTLAACGVVDNGGQAPSASRSGTSDSGVEMTASPSPPEGQAGEASAPPMSPSDLPTMTAPTAPPTAPTDRQASNVVAGRVVALSERCVDVETDDGVVWSLAGDPGDSVSVGATVRAKVSPASAKAPCGEGKAADLVALSVVR